MSFTQRVVNSWNSLPNTDVDAPTIQAFKWRLDKHWANQEIKYNYEANLDLLVRTSRNLQDLETQDQ